MDDRTKMVELYMKKLGISKEEAEQMYQDEMEDNLPELSSEQKKVVKEMTQADRKKETAPRKRERKPDNDKRALINAMEEMLSCSDIQADNVVIINPEREIEFVYNNVKYRLTLAKPREKK